MNPNHPESDPQRPACAETIAALQQFMDGETPEESAAVRGHRDTCVPCREEWLLARMLMRRPSKPVVVPSSLIAETERSIARDQTRRRRQRLLAWSLLPATAAVVLIAVFWPGRADETPGEPFMTTVAKVTIREDNAPGIALDKSLAEAKSAMASLSGKVVPDRPEVTITLPKVEPMAEAEPAWDRLADAGDGLKTGVKPVTSSARRAMNMLFKATETLTFADTSRKNRP